MNATERYELIRPIIQNQKTAKQVHTETGVPCSTIYRYLSRFEQGNREVESLADRSSASHTRPHAFTDDEKSLVIDSKLHHPEKSARQIARELRSTGVLKISYHTVSDILKQHRVTSPPFCRRPVNCWT